MKKKFLKIIKRQAAREARAKLGSELELLKEIFKPKPKWCPQWLCGVGLSIYVRKGEWEFEPWKEDISKSPDNL